MLAVCCALPHCVRRAIKAASGEIGAAELRAVEDAAIRDAVALQETAGLHAITDGEFRRGHYLVDFMTALDGIVPTNTSYALSFRGEKGETGETRSMLTVTGKVRRKKPIMLEAFLFLKSVTSRTPKICIPSPTWVHMRGGQQDRKPGCLSRYRGILGRCGARLPRGNPRPRGGRLHLSPDRRNQLRVSVRCARSGSGSKPMGSIPTV